ncbi:MAG: hypothetical protein C5B55_10205, partial [Blastocatellia bacterium]
PEPKTVTVQAPTPPPKTSEGHREQEVPEPNIPEPGNPSRRNGAPTIRTGPGGATIRNFPDGSQLITTPDGMRVYIDAHGRRQILYPGQRPNRKKVPPTP